MDDSDVEDNNQIMNGATSARKRLHKVTSSIPKLTQIEKNEPQLPTLHEFIIAQSTDTYRDKNWPTVVILALSLNFNKNSVSVGQSPIDEPMKKAIPQPMRPTILHLTHHATLVSHWGKHLLYNTLRREYNSRNQLTAVYNTVWLCQESLQV